MKRSVSVIKEENDSNQLSICVLWKADPLPDSLVSGNLTGDKKLATRIGKALEVDDGLFWKPTVNESTAHLKKTLYYIFAIYNNVCHGQKPAVKSEYVTTI